MASTRYASTFFPDGSKYDEFGRNPRGRRQIRGFSPIQGSGIDQFKILQDRSVPALYNPYNLKMSPLERADQLRRTGGTVDGDLIAPDLPFMRRSTAAGMQQGGQNQEEEVIAPLVMPTPMAQPDFSQFNRSMLPAVPVPIDVAPFNPVRPTMEDPFRPQVGGSAPQAAQAPDNSFAQRLADARAAVQERKNLQAMQEQNYRGQFRAPSPGNVSLNSPYGTGAVSFTGQKSPASFDGVSREEWFRGAANRQGISNKFGMTMEDEVAARRKQQGKGVS